jgi:hypothetical protein
VRTNFFPRALTNVGVRGKKLIGGVGWFAVYESGMRSRGDLRR